VFDAPSHIKWPNINEGDLYTLIMLDPDAPSRYKPNRKGGLHWLVVNIPGNNMEQGIHLASYNGAGPPENSGLHRYVFAIYKQGGKIDTENKKVKKYGMTARMGLGAAHFVTPLLQTYIEAGANSMTPVALNWFNAGYDESVPIIIRKFLGRLGFLAPLLLWASKQPKQPNN